jgi:maltose alpha-D-glucosyltransferase/alpha-amylase
MPQFERVPEDDPLWYKDAVIYELHVKAFYDSNDDGLGDFKGLREKLDYLEGLGITAIWLLPFYPSPLKDDGYDIADYFNVNPQYGSLREFREFLREAHNRGIRVITELVLNHTSDQHSWFQKARKAKPGSPWRDFYVWSDSPEKYGDTRIIFKDFETSNWAWDPVAKSYYWHRFYSHQPDLNYDNPEVQREVFRVLDYWFRMGVDGLRLDAVPYLFEREGTNCENLPETYDMLKRLRAHVDAGHRNRMLLAEANQWPEDAVAYFGNGDSCHMAFHFPLMPRMFMALQMEDRFPMIDIMEQTPAIRDSNQWALFLRNHDELTLEMVTDEERDYMYRVYAKDPTARINLGIRRRLAPLVGNHRRKIEIMNVLLFSFPGTPVIYYGDEIGMGDNYYLGDRNGVRTPMQWSADRNAGFSKANPQKLYLPTIIDPEYHFEALNVETQERNPSSLLWWMKRVIGMRKKFKAFGRGNIEFVQSDNPKVLAFTRQYQDEIILVIVNLSKFAQVVELNLSRYAGFIPQEIFSQNKFPPIKDSPYVITLGFYDYFWFSLQREEEVIRMGDFMWIAPELNVDGGWETILREKTKEKLEEEILPVYITGCRWFTGKARKIRHVTILEHIPVTLDSSVSQILFLKVSYAEGAPDVYLLPLSFSMGENAEKIVAERPLAVVASLYCVDGKGILYDAVYDEAFQKQLLSMIAKRKVIRGKRGDLTAHHRKRFKGILGKRELPLSPQLLKGEQSNTSFIYENVFFLKLYRKLEEGVNPDTEIMRFLTEKRGFAHVPPFAGSLEFKTFGSEPVIIGQLMGLVPNQGDAWSFTLDSLEKYFERVLAKKSDISQLPGLPSSTTAIEFHDVPPILQELIGGNYIEMTGLLGKRTAELHRALSSAGGDPNFMPEPFTLLYQRSVYQSMQSLAKKNLDLLRKNIKSLSADLRDEAEKIAGLEKEILERFNALMSKKISAMKIRTHGDYHLGQVLWTGNDFIIIDFEGEPERSLTERRLKRSPIRDVAGMIRSFHYASYHALLKQTPFRLQDIPQLEPWADLWYSYISGVFLNSYLGTVGDAAFVPQSTETFEIILRAFLLEKAVYELGYELNSRPDWVIIPIRGIKQLLRSPQQ